MSSLKESPVHPDGSVAAKLDSDRSHGIEDYVALARPDHWFKNVFMVIGIILAYFYRPGVLGSFPIGTAVWAFFATCLVASSNYVLNEILDAPQDRHHPLKRNRPVAGGRVHVSWAYCEWLLLGVVGLAMAFTVNWAFFATASLLWLMGLAYNVPPIRAKEVPYVDVLSESINNPLRLALGWYVVGVAAIPPLSLLISYWMVGAFFMATKRFAEYRSIDNPVRAGAYRSSFRHYDHNRLLVSMFFYVTAAALFLGVFIVRYHLELILSVPLIAGFFAYYLRLALEPNSPVETPEKLYRQWPLMIYLGLCLAVFVVLMLIRITALYEWFNVLPSEFPPLWSF